MNTTRGQLEHVQHKTFHQVTDLSVYRRQRFAALYGDIQAWDNGTEGHLAALLGCARIIDEALGGVNLTPERLTKLRYGFGLRRARVEEALNSLAELPSTYSCLLDSINELDLLLERAHKTGFHKTDISIHAATRLASRVNEGLWSALLSESHSPGLDQKTIPLGKPEKAVSPKVD